MAKNPPKTSAAAAPVVQPTANETDEQVEFVRAALAAIGRSDCAVERNGAEIVVKLPIAGDEKYPEAAQVSAGFDAWPMPVSAAQFGESLKGALNDAALYSTGTHPDQQEPVERIADFKRLAEVRNLPEVPADAELEAIGFEPGSIERFIAGEDDRRVMQVVGFSGGFAVQEVPQDEAA